MHQPTPLPQARSVITASTGTGPIGIIERLLALLAIALLSFSFSHAQCVVQNGSFENLNTAQVPIPNTSPSVNTETAIPGSNGWFSRLASPDIFWPPLYVPSNFMTSAQGPINAFDGNNYAGISTGYFAGVFMTETLAGTLTSSPVGQPYEVRARFAMGTARNNPCHVYVWLDGPSGLYPVGYMLVNSPNWQLFSQIINIPSGNYNRIVISGVNNLPHYAGGYAFIDSVDVCAIPQDPCKYLHASLQYAGSGCCWKLYIDNTLPASLGEVYGVRSSVLAPSTLSGSPTNGTGWMNSTTPPYTVLWNRSSGGPDPTGTGQYVGTYCINPGTPPQTHIIDFLSKDGKVLCRDTVYTDCAQESHPCMEFGHPTVSCGPVDSSGNRTYTVNVPMSALNAVPGYFSLSSPNGTVSPSIVPLPPYSQFVNFTFTDTPPQDTQACIVVERHAQGHGIDSILCRDTLCFSLPVCPENCCDGFLKSFATGHIAVSGGNVTLTGCALAGPNQIKRFSATIVAVQIRTVCNNSIGPWVRAYGDIIAGSLSAPLAGPQFVPTLLYSREAVWGGPASPNCVSMSPCVPYTLKMVFPNPPVGHGCRDTLKFAIRYSFTDCRCVTCDTTLYYTLVRKPVILPTGGGPIGQLDSGIVHTAPISELLNISMSSETHGVLAVTLPNGDGEDPIRIVGMRVRPLGVAIAALNQSGLANSATISGNEASIAYELDEGNSTLFDLTYYNGNGDRMIPNMVAFDYINTSDPTDTLTSDTVEVDGYVPSEDGGDVVEKGETSLADVKTFVLHLAAYNDLGLAVHGLRLKVNDGATLIAVGPVGDGTKAVLTPGTDQDGNTLVQVDKHTWTVETVAPSAVLNPIYLTFAGVGDGGVSVDFATLDGTGAGITTGSVAISTPMRVAGVGQESAETGVSLLPIYPNPSKQTATVQFTLHDANQVTVSIRDVNGKEVLRPISAEHLQSGDHLLPLRTDALPQGSYIVVLNVDGHLYTRPMTIVR